MLLNPSARSPFIVSLSTTYVLICRVVVISTLFVGDLFVGLVVDHVVVVVVESDRGWFFRSFCPIDRNRAFC